MNYNSRSFAHKSRHLRTVVIYPPKASEVLSAYREEKNLPPLPIEELKFGMDEVMQIVNILGAEILTGGQANIYGLLNILKEPTDILWIISHGVEEGWFLNDGLVSASEMTSLVRSSGVFLTVLNTCESYEVAFAISQELGTALVSTLTEVPDRQAFFTATLFARHLAEGQDYVAAWNAAKPGQKHPYILLEARGKKRMNQRPGRENPDPYGRLFESVRELERIVFGDSRLGIPPLREFTLNLQAEVRRIADDVSDIQKKLEIIVDRQEKRNRYLLIGGGIILVLMTIIAFLIFQPGVTT